MKQAVIVFLVLFLSACSSTPRHDKSSVGPEVNETACHVVYDAGSSGTRLYIYQQAAAGWVKHKGPRTAALADPVRGNRNKTLADVVAVTDAVVTALDDIRRDGPLQPDGSRGWQAFDWQTQCRLETVAVYATAGMRLAELEHPVAAEQLWDRLNRKLSSALDMAVTTRTLSGFEEGLYAWLAAREAQVDGSFGIVEMGGASAQISFPCRSCAASRLVIVRGTDVPMVSYSLLGMGQDEVWKKYSDRAACKPGAGLDQPQWQAEDCTNGIEMSEDIGPEVKAGIRQADVRRWDLTGAFIYARPSDIDTYCRDNIDSGFEPESSCFRAVYQPFFLNLLGVPVGSERSDTEWTLGAVICTASSCLAKAGPPESRWSGSALD